MTDDEIIKALECCCKDDCDSCPNNFGNCNANLAKEALDLISRQQVEIESLKNANGLFEYLNYAAHHYVINGKTWTQEFATIKARNKAIQDKVVLLSDIQTSKSEAVREFAKKLKKFFTENFNSTGFEDILACFICTAIDELVEEMGCNDG